MCGAGVSAASRPGVERTWTWWMLLVENAVESSADVCLFLVEVVVYV